MRNVNKYNWEEIEQYCDQIVGKMKADSYSPDAIVCLLRGGMVPARIFADKFNITSKLFTIDVKYYTGIGETTAEPVVRCPFDIVGNNLLVVDDICDSGRTLDCVRLFLRDNFVRTATVFCKEGIIRKPDYWQVSVPDETWVVFPWEKSEFERGYK